MYMWQHQSLCATELHACQKRLIRTSDPAARTVSHVLTARTAHMMPAFAKGWSYCSTTDDGIERRAGN
eukprot:633558-Pleurochrysis_carterae.AAC.1